MTCSTSKPESSTSGRPGVVVDGQVIESDGKTENPQHVLALDPFTVAVLAGHVEMLDRELALTTTISACCSAGKTACRLTLTRSQAGSRRSPGTRASRT